MNFVFTVIRNRKKEIKPARGIARFKHQIKQSFHANNKNIKNELTFKKRISKVNLIISLPYHVVVEVEHSS